MIKHFSFPVIMSKYVSLQLPFFSSSSLSTCAIALSALTPMNALTNIKENTSLSSARHDGCNNDINDDDVNYDDYHSKDVCPFDPREFSTSASQTRTRGTKHRNYLWTHISMQFPIQSCAPVQGEAIRISGTFDKCSFG